MLQNQGEEEYISVAEAAAETGYSRIHIVRLIHAEKIKAKRIGRSFVVEKKSLPVIFGEISKNEEKEIDKAVDKVFKNYGDAIKKLGKE